MCGLKKKLDLITYCFLFVGTPSNHLAARSQHPNYTVASPGPAAGIHHQNGLSLDF